MKHALIVIDDLLPDPETLRAGVVGSDFKPETGPDGFVYSGISRYVDVAVYESLAHALKSRIRPDLAFWRLDLAGEKPHSFCHADDNCSKYAAIIYLNLPHQCVGGTAFWRHIPTGAVEMPTDLELTQAEIEPDKFKEEMTLDWKNPEMWAYHGSVAMAFNRCAVYPTSRFHSRVPAEAFGNGPGDGRLVGVIFFDFVSDEPSPPAAGV